MNKEEWKETFEKSNINDIVENIQTFDVNDWGSCQYSTALGLFKLFERMKQTITFTEACEVIGITISFDKIREFPEVQSMMLEDANISIQEADDDMSLTWAKEHQQRIKEAVTAEDLFEALRKSAWDLWSASPHVVSKYFDNIRFEGVPKSPGQGPEWNVAAQSVNFMTGLCCALLVEHKIITNEEAFGDFDT